jgi:hypothetical protein
LTRSLNCSVIGHSTKQLDHYRHGSAARLMAD